MSSENVGLLEIERIFEAKVKPETLTIKASRMQGITNVTPESKVIEIITEMPKILENRHPMVSLKKCAPRSTDNDVLESSVTELSGREHRYRQA